jgi:molybdopterin-binding protein
MCQVDVKLVGTDYKMSSVMTLESLDAMGLKTGDRVNVIAKAVNVLLTRS